MALVTMRITMKLSFWEALKDLTWFAFLIMGIGGLSLVSIIEGAVFNDLTWIAPLELLLAGYHRIADLIGVIVEPPIHPIIDWINRHWNWQLQIQPFWRPLFILSMIPVASAVRMAWRAGYSGRATTALVFQTLGALIGALIAGAVQVNEGWWAQGLIAASPVIANHIFGAIGAIIIYLARRRPASAWKALLIMLVTTLPTASLVFVSACVMSFIPVVGGGAGVIVLSIWVALVGIGEITDGLRDADRNRTRLGFSMIGGFVVAGIMFLTNWVGTMLASIDHLG